MQRASKRFLIFKKFIRWKNYYFKFIIRLGQNWLISASDFSDHVRFRPNLECFKIYIKNLLMYNLSLLRPSVAEFRPFKVLNLRVFWHDLRILEDCSGFVFLLIQKIRNVLSLWKSGEELMCYHINLKKYFFWWYGQWPQFFTSNISKTCPPIPEFFLKR